jgi:hypothetical protein
MYCNGMLCTSLIGSSGVVALLQAGALHFRKLEATCLTLRLKPMTLLLLLLLFFFFVFHVGEEKLRQSGVSYTIVRPAGLTSGPGGKAELVAGGWGSCWGHWENSAKDWSVQTHRPYKHFSVPILSCIAASMVCTFCSQST